jgi:hypothetical protein
MENVSSDNYPHLLVAVGMPITRHPPHRSGHALLAHPAPTWGFGVEALIFIFQQ